MSHAHIAQFEDIVDQHLNATVEELLQLSHEELLKKLLKLRDLTVGWIDSAAMFQRNSDYYRGLVVEIGELFGEEAKTSDDGSVQDGVLCAKVPELVKKYR